MSAERSHQSAEQVSERIWRVNSIAELGRIFKYPKVQAAYFESAAAPKGLNLAKCIDDHEVRSMRHIDIEDALEWKEGSQLPEFIACDVQEVLRAFPQYKHTNNFIVYKGNISYADFLHQDDAYPRGSIRIIRTLVGPSLILSETGDGPLIKLASHATCAFRLGTTKNEVFHMAPPIEIESERFSYLINIEPIN